MSYNLFLDDLRKPAHAYIYPKRDSEGKTMPSRSLANQTGIKDDDWIIVRSYDEFVFTLNSKGVPITFHLIMICIRSTLIIGLVTLSNTMKSYMIILKLKQAGIVRNI